MKKIIVGIWTLALALTAFSAQTNVNAWMNHPFTTQLLPSDTIILGRTNGANTNLLMRADDLLNQARTNAVLAAYTLTNWVSGKLQTNSTGRMIYIDASVLVSNRISTLSQLDLRFGTAANVWFKTNSARWLGVGTNTFQLSGFVTNGGTWTFTNVANNPEILVNSGSITLF